MCEDKFYQANVKAFFQSILLACFDTRMFDTNLNVSVQSHCKIMYCCSSVQFGIV